jgi:ubiquitin-protein ligase E3 B
VNLLLGGGDGELDVDDLARHTVLSGGYRADSRAVCNLWAVLKAWPSEQRRAVLRFVTSTERAPLLGFQHLHPPFTIHKVGSTAAAFRACPCARDIRVGIFVVCALFESAAARGSNP